MNNVGLSGSLKLLLVLHFLTGLVLGLGLLFARTTLGDILGVNFTDPGWLFVGASYLGLGAGSLFALKSGSWQGTAVLVKAEIVFLISVLIGLVIWHFSTGLPPMIQLLGILGVVFLVWFTAEYKVHCKKT
ncbi:MAG: hypothetical protein KDH94_00930 [Coxiellaceae bacterium]|nr:hypothetical protein [Coxiellaceae bacterium]